MQDTHFLRILKDSAATIRSLADQADAVGAVCRTCIDTLQSGQKLLTAGNGGSAAEALHMSEELVGRFRDDRRSLPAISLVADTTALTCISNDYGYDYVFSRQVEGLGQAGDVLVLFSTSGNGAALLNAAKAARERDIRVIGFLGKTGGPLAPECDQAIVVGSQTTERIQEAHQVLLHVVLDEIERVFC